MPGISSFGYSGLSSTAVPQERFNARFLPGEKFDQTRFSAALNAYMKYSGEGMSKSEHKGRFEEKSRLMANLNKLGEELAKQPNSYEAMEALVKALKKGADQLTSYWFGQSTVGSSLLKEWHSALKAEFEKTFSLQENESSYFGPGSPVLGLGRR